MEWNGMELAHNKRTLYAAWEYNIIWKRNLR